MGAQQLCLLKETEGKGKDEYCKGLQKSKDFKQNSKTFFNMFPAQEKKKWQNIGTYMAWQGDFNSSVLIQTSICNNVSGSDTEDANRKVCSII